MSIIIATDKTIEERKRICTKCISYNADLNICKVCKCLISLKVKVKQAQCPRGKWLRE
jgi:hypothetical protein